MKKGKSEWNIEKGVRGIVGGRWRFKNSCERVQRDKGRGRGKRDERERENCGVEIESEERKMKRDWTDGWYRKGAERKK